MSIRPLFGLRDGADEEHWISVSDLMAGLMVIFLFIAIVYIRPIIQVQNTIREIVVAWNDSEVDIYKALEEEFKNDLPRWRAEIERETLTIRFTAPDVLFDRAASTLKPEFRQILSDFFPRYLKTLSRYNDAIAEVRIEGHTSSEWDANASTDEAYFRNMELSQARTRTVLEYCLTLAETNPFKDWARKFITANGLSSSQLVFVDGEEDKSRSRRVEFRVRTNTKEQIVRVLETLN